MFSMRTISIVAILAVVVSFVQSLDSTDVTVYPLQVTAKESTQVILTCKFRDSMYAYDTIKWMHNGTTFIPDSKKYQYNKGNTGNYTLLIKQLKKHDAGKFNCRIENKNGNYTSEDISINVLTESQVEITIDPQEAWDKGENKNVTLHCNIVSGNPNYITGVRWSKNWHVFAETGDCDSENLIGGDKSNVYRPGDPFSLSLSSDDPAYDEFGFYSCRGFSSYGWGLPSEHIQFPVNYKPGPANLMFITPMAMRGESFYMFCLAIERGRPPNKKYHWYRKGISIEGATSACYEIPELSFNDDGNYSCEAYNSAGSGDMSSKVLKVSARLAINKMIDMTYLRNL